MLGAVTAGVGHPVVAALLGLAAAGLAGMVVAMAWNVHVRQFRLAEMLARRQAPVTAVTADVDAGTGRSDRAVNGTGHPEAALDGTALDGTGLDRAGLDRAGLDRAALDRAALDRAGLDRAARDRAALDRAARDRAARDGTALDGAGLDRAARDRAALDGAAGPGGPAGAGPASPVAIEGPDMVLIGEQARYRARLSGGGTVVSWAVGGGSVWQAPDPAHPGELLVTADQPGNLTVIVRVRKGLAERRATKAVTAEEGVTTPAPPVTLRLFLQGWPLVVVAVLVTGFAGALVALGSFTSADFIAVAVPLIALLGMAAVVLSAGDAPGPSGRGGTPPRLRAEDPWYGVPSHPYPAARAGETANHN